METILNYLKEHEDEFAELIEELDSWNGYLGDNRYYEMEMLNELYHDAEPMEILYRAFYGHDENYGEQFNPNRNYFRYNGYGNLVSTDYKDYSDYLDEYFVNELLKERKYLTISEDLEELLEEETK